MKLITITAEEAAQLFENNTTLETNDTTPGFLASKLSTPSGTVWLVQGSSDKILKFYS